MLSRQFISALWSPAGKGMTSWLSFVMLNCVFVTFPCGILGQVWYVIVSIPDLCHISYLYNRENFMKKKHNIARQRVAKVSIKSDYFITRVLFERRICSANCHF